MESESITEDVDALLDTLDSLFEEVETSLHAEAEETAEVADTSDIIDANITVIETQLNPDKDTCTAVVADISDITDANITVIETPQTRNYRSIKLNPDKDTGFAAVADAADITDANITVLENELNPDKDTGSDSLEDISDIMDANITVIETTPTQSPQLNPENSRDTVQPQSNNLGKSNLQVESPLVNNKSDLVVLDSTGFETSAPNSCHATSLTMSKINQSENTTFQIESGHSPAGLKKTHMVVVDSTGFETSSESSCHAGPLTDKMSRYSSISEAEITPAIYSSISDTELASARYSSISETELASARYSSVSEAEILPAIYSSISETELASARYSSISETELASARYSSISETEFTPTRYSSISETEFTPTKYSSISEADIMPARYSTSAIYSSISEAEITPPRCPSVSETEITPAKHSTISDDSSGCEKRDWKYEPKPCKVFNDIDLRCKIKRIQHQRAVANHGSKGEVEGKQDHNSNTIITNNAANVVEIVDGKNKGDMDSTQESEMLSDISSFIHTTLDAEIENTEITETHIDKNNSVLKSKREKQAKCPSDKVEPSAIIEAKESPISGIPKYDSAALARHILRNPKRKFNVSISDAENTPKRRNIRFDSQYSSELGMLSPIKKDVDNDLKGEKDLAFSPGEQTPTVLSKFNQWKGNECSNIVNSTPRLHSEKDKLKAKKAILKFDRIDTDRSESEYSGTSSRLSTGGDDIDTLISEITAICDEGLMRDHNFSMAIEDEDLVTDKENCISKIDINELISEIDSELDQTYYERGEGDANGTIVRNRNSVAVSVENDGKSMGMDKTVTGAGDFDQGDVTSQENRSGGRFRNVTAMVSKAEFNDDELDLLDEGDLLGLDDFDADEFIDEQSLATIAKSIDLTITHVKEVRKEDEKTEININLSDSKLRERDGERSTEIESDLEKTVVEVNVDKFETNKHVDEDKSSKEGREISTDLENKVIEVQLDNMKANEQKEEGSDIEKDAKIIIDVDNLNNVKGTGVISKGVEQNAVISIDDSDLMKDLDKDRGTEPATVDIKANMTEEKMNLKEKIAADKKIESELKDEQIMANFDTSFCRLEDNSPEMRAARLRWKSNGVPDPEINLTVATTFRKDEMLLEATHPVGFLEGEKICCLDLFENEMEYKGMQYTTIHHTLERLHHQRTVLNNMKYDTIHGLRRDMDRDIEVMRTRQSREIQQLQFRQHKELRKVENRRNMMPIVLQNAILRLNHEHTVQRERMQAVHRSAYGRLCEQWDSRLHHHQADHGQREAALENQISQVQNTAGDMGVTEGNNHYGPPVMVTLRKAPCRATNGKHSQITMCLSAFIGQAMSLEDDVYDHFYSYKEKK